MVTAELNKQKALVSSKIDLQFKKKLVKDYRVEHKSLITRTGWGISPLPPFVNRKA
jgi:hypothetical protein